MVMTTQHRSRGRPRGRKVRVSRTINMTPEAYDALCRRAMHERVSIHELMVRGIEREAGISRSPKNPT
jgi:hypothetical protein